MAQVNMLGAFTGLDEMARNNAINDQFRLNNQMQAIRNREMLAVEQAQNMLPKLMQQVQPTMQTIPGQAVGPVQPMGTPEQGLAQAMLPMGTGSQAFLGLQSPGDRVPVEVGTTQQMVRPSMPVPTNRAEMLAQQMYRDQQKKQAEQYKPLLDYAMKSGDDRLRQSLVGAIGKYDPDTADIVSQMKFGDTPTLPFDFKNPAVRASFFSKYGDKLAEFGYSTSEDLPKDTMMVSFNQDKTFKNFAPYRRFGKTDEEIELENAKLEERRKNTKLRELSLSPEAALALEESKQYGKEQGKVGPTLPVKLMEVDGTVEKLTNLRTLASDPASFGSFASAMNAGRRLYGEWTKAKSSGDEKTALDKRSELETSMSALFNDSLKKSFGPPFSDSDLKIMFSMTGMDLKDQGSFMKAIDNAEKMALRERAMLQKQVKMQGAAPKAVAARGEVPDSGPTQPKRPTKVPPGSVFRGTDKRTGNPVYELKGAYFDGVTGRRLQ